MARLPWTTAFRMAAWFSAAFTILTIILGAAIYWAMRHELRYDLDQRIVGERAGVLREAAEDNAGLARVIASRAKHERGDMRYALLDASGRRIAGQPVNARAAPGWSHLDFIDAAGAPDDARVFASATADGGTLIVGADPKAIEELDGRMIPLFAAAFGLITAIGVAGALLLSRILQHRLDAINRTAEAIIGGDLGSRMRLTGSGDEFDRLSHTLNRMLERIAGLIDNLRQVSSDIAHDLSTPLNRLRHKLEEIAARSAETGPNEVGALKLAADNAIAQTDDMLALFTAILGVSEIEAGGAGVRMTTLDLSAVVADLADSYQPSIEDAGRRLARDIAPGIRIEGNRELLAQALVNLLDNALLHTPAGTAIAISLVKRGATVALAVSDHGPGVAAADRARVFERFTRLDSSRMALGHGLGLSLVAAIARAHGGTASLHDNHPGAIVVLDLPG